MMVDRRASASDYPHAAEKPLVRVVEAGDLDGKAWDDLLARALAPHPHYSRHVVSAHRQSGLITGKLSVVTVWRSDRLLAALPYRIGRDASTLGARVAMPWRSPFTPSTAPLVAADEPLEETLALLVRGLAEAGKGRPWRWPLLTTSAPLGSAFLIVLRAAGWRIGIVDSFERPILKRRDNLDAFAKDHPHKNRLKDLRRRHRRLAELGTLETRTVTEGPAMKAAVEAFLELEGAGWKGDAGTAMRCSPNTAAFARAAFGHAEGPIDTRADILELDGRPLAISLALVVGGIAALLKTTYDETERQHSPGMLLEGELVRLFHETAFADRLDSATLPGSALENLYPERETVSEMIAIPPGGAGMLSLGRRLALARLEHRAKARAKRLLKRR